MTSCKGLCDQDCLTFRDCDRDIVTRYADLVAPAGQPPCSPGRYRARLAGDGSTEAWELVKKGWRVYRLEEVARVRATGERKVNVLADKDPAAPFTRGESLDLLF